MVARDEFLDIGEGLVIEQELEVSRVHSLLRGIAVEPGAVALFGEIGGEGILRDDVEDALEGQPGTLLFHRSEFFHGGRGRACNQS